MPCLNYVYVDVDYSNKNGAAKFISTDLNKTNEPTYRKTEGNYPDVLSVFPPEDRHVHRHVINAEFLIGLLQVAKEVNYAVEILIPEEYGPIELRIGDKVKSDNGQQFIGLLMPITK